MGHTRIQKAPTPIEANMIPRIKECKPLEDYKLLVTFDSGDAVIYDVKDDITQIDSFKPLETIAGLFEQVQLDESRTCIFWNDIIDLPSDTLLEYGKPIQNH